MSVVNIHNAKTHLSQLIEQVLDGQEVIIAKADKPLVVLSLYKSEVKSMLHGAMKNEIEIADDFDELPESFIKYFT